MFKLFFLYPLIILVCVWLASDVEIGASVYKFEDNYISLQFPKKSIRSAGSDPWIDFYWNAASARKDIVDIKETITN
ncbi:hypothetical protein E2R68_13545 [Psychromonas sp. RZ22]|uniref:hypothetical protein n=1 Tax=Psychromonas algarum TaxID=2555643 RepID=UPI0010673228|nr:hypothetical protein [Psychromonas sp. RZ22]TEW53175.1 hypothetical protein E2R68_13545 [Psychromonas sp. RZ22]